jgi:hypothetical protein
MHTNIGKHKVIVRLSSFMIEHASLDYLHKKIELNLSFNKERIHLFDKTTEYSLV